MKVTVCFGSTKVIVPCGQGELLVSDLIEKATTRYKKAIGKPPDYWVTVISLKSFGDGGILDLDDQLKDVADDREQIVALYEEQEAPPIPHNGGDGTSASSVGTSSPDIFQGSEYNNNKEYRRYLRHNHQHDVVITQNDLNSFHNGSSLIVRRGSEPTLTKLVSDDSGTFSPDFIPVKPCIKRWSAISGADEVKSRTIAVQPGRREPLGGRSDEDIKHGSPPITPPGKQGHLVILQNTSGPLGIHVVPEFDNASRERGLLVQSVEEGGRVHQDGRVAPHDVIVEINGTSLGGVDFSKAQEIFRQSLHADALKLLIVKAPPPLPVQPPPTNRPLSPISTTPTRTTVTPDKRSNSSYSSDHQVAGGTPVKINIKPLDTEATEVPDSPTRGPPPPIPARNPNTALTSTRFVATNTRKLGKTIHIQLTKGPQGLGFSVTTRDNPTGGHVPIYIKNILPKGAAIEDGNLKPGDRLLEVNGIEMTGKSQTEAVTVLRNTKMGGVVNLIVSRQLIENSEDDADSNTVQKGDSSGSLDVSDTREILTFDIALNDLETSGLGLNVKGKTITSPEGAISDLGIFIKAIIDGGAAAKDGRIKLNDQLVEVNGDKLAGKTNPQAMEVLRDAVKKESSTPGSIRLVLQRKIDNTRILSVHEARISQSDNKTSSVWSNEQQRDGTSKSKSSINANANPLLARVKREQSLRNVSYQFANHDSLVNDTMQDSVFVDPGKKPMAYGLTIAAKNINNPEGSSILIQADSPSTVRMRSNSSSSVSRVRPASTLGFMTSDPVESRSRLSVSKSNQDLLDGDTKWLKEWDKSGDVVQDEKSPTDEVDPSKTFQREGFGRQSMSEKRKGHVDPRMTEFYQKIKSGKESGSSQFISASWDPRRSALQQIEAQTDEVGPMLGLKKSTSLESLQTAVQEDEAPSGAKNGQSTQASRGRGVNESFRAAVDRSYEQTAEAMETVEEEGSEVGSVSQDSRSRASSFSGPEAEKRSKKAKKEKEKSLFKGFFKMGKSKKADSKAKSSEELHDSDRVKTDNQKRVDDREWLHEQRQLAAEKQRLAEQQEEQRRLEEPIFQRPVSPVHPGDAPLSRADKIQKLRQEHQRRHRERQGQYPLDAEEERRIEELEIQKNALRKASDSSYYGNVPLPPRQRHDDSMKYERAQPAFVEGDHYGHYQNIKEIQAQLRKHDHYQQRYHGQVPAGYTPSHTTAGYTPNHTAAMYTPSHTTAGYTPSHAGSAYTPSHATSGHAPSGHAPSGHAPPGHAPSGYTPGNYSREVNMPPPADPRHHQRGYTAVTPHVGQPLSALTPHTRQPHHNDVLHYGYYTPHHPGYRTAVAPTHTPAPYPHATPHQHNHTPANQGTYISHSALSNAAPQIIVNAPAQDYARQRAYSEFDTEPRTAYREPPYGSLSRRRERRDIPGSAQV